MVNQEKVYKNILKLLENSKAEYKLFNHKAAFSYEELNAVQKETGFRGTEGKCLVVKTEDSFVVCITIQGKKLDFLKLGEILNKKKIRLAKSDELKEHFGAEPGCAYPFGFDESIDIYVDSDIYVQDWFLFSPIFPTKKIQIKGLSLKKVFGNIKNKVKESFNIFI